MEMHDTKDRKLRFVFLGVKEKVTERIGYGLVLWMSSTLLSSSGLRDSGSHLQGRLLALIPGVSRPFQREFLWPFTVLTRVTPQPTVRDHGLRPDSKVSIAFKCARACIYIR